MPKSGTSGSVRGAVSNDRPYRDTLLAFEQDKMLNKNFWIQVARTVKANAAAVS